MNQTVTFALNHMAVPKLGLPEFFDLACRLGLTSVEIRNDLPGNAIMDGTPADTVARLARQKGIKIISINALQRFNDWNAARGNEATELANYARDCGARAVVLCPVNDRAHRHNPETRAARLREALTALSDIFMKAEIDGLIEPLGFEECSLRTKREAIEAITELGIGNRFSLVHDTFHHYLSDEAEMFPAHTGLVHISGVEDKSLSKSSIRDGDRLLVRPADILGNIVQLKTLLDGGLEAPFSFEPFSSAVHELIHVEDALKESMTFITQGL